MNHSTPALTVDVDIFEANLKSASKLVSGTGKFLRPHFKTHRTPALALRQCCPEVIGFTCATVGEVETLADAGLDHLLLANEVVSVDKIDKLAQLATKVDLIVAVDSTLPLREFNEACHRAGSTIGVLADIDIGLKRCGVREVIEVEAIAHEATQLGRIRFRGLMGYEGRVRSQEPDRSRKIQQSFSKLDEMKSHLELKGFPVEIVSGAGTSTMIEALAAPVFTEIQAGTYCIMEPDILDLGLPFQCAVWVVGTVISTKPGRVILDVGRRSITPDHGFPFPEYEHAKVVALNDEHAIMEWNAPMPVLGERVRLRPTQNRTTFNLHEEVWLERNQQIEERLPITARGRS
jgi:D-serine deaminase-like pyridoxal phosphate-dependent protein